MLTSVGHPTVKWAMISSQETHVGKPTIGKPWKRTGRMALRSEHFRVGAPSHWILSLRDVASRAGSTWGGLVDSLWPCPGRLRLLQQTQPQRLGQQNGSSHRPGAGSPALCSWQDLSSWLRAGSSLSREHELWGFFHPCRIALS